MLGKILDIGGGDGRNGGSEGAKVEVGGAVGIQGINVYRPPVYVGHGGSCALSTLWTLELRQGGVSVVAVVVCSAVAVGASWAALELR